MSQHIYKKVQGGYLLHQGRCPFHAARGDDEGDGGAEQSLMVEEAAPLTSPLGSIHSEHFISHMPCLVALSPSAKCSFFLL